MRLLLLMLTLAFLASCATQNYYYDTVASWDKGHVNSLVKHWGKPDKRMRTPQGHTLLVYYTKSYHQNASTTTPAVGMHVNRDGKPTFTEASRTNNTWNRGSQSSVCSAVFEINKKGTIVKTETLGGGCYAGQSFEKTRSNPAKKPKFAN